MDDITKLLSAVEAGETSAAEALLPAVYDELHRLASMRMAQFAPGQTIQATVLVHDAWLKLMGAERRSWSSRRHFFNAAALVMQRILLDVARQKRAARRGGGQRLVALEGLECALPTDPDQFLRVHDALERLAGLYPAEAELVRLKFYIGLEHTEAAETLGMPLRTIERKWRFARAWLMVALEGADPSGGPIAAGQAAT